MFRSSTILTELVQSLAKVTMDRVDHSRIKGTTRRLFAHIYTVDIFVKIRIRDVTHFFYTFSILLQSVNN